MHPLDLTIPGTGMARSTLNADQGLAAHADGGVGLLSARNRLPNETRVEDLLINVADGDEVSFK